MKHRIKAAAITALGMAAMFMVIAEPMVRRR